MQRKDLLLGKQSIVIIQSIPTPSEVLQQHQTDPTQLREQLSPVFIHPVVSELSIKLCENGAFACHLFGNVYGLALSLFMSQE